MPQVAQWVTLIPIPHSCQDSYWPLAQARVETLNTGRVRERSVLCRLDPGRALLSLEAALMHL